MSQELFLKNCNRWRAFAPQWADTVLNIDWTLKPKSTAEKVEAFVVEANASLQHLRKNVSVIYACDVADGTYYTSLREWLLSEEHFLVLLDSDLEKIAYLLASKWGEEIVCHPRVYLFYLDPNMQVLETAASLFMGLHFDIFISASYKNLYPNLLENIKKKLDFLDNLYAPIVAEYKDLGKTFFNNYLRNVFQWTHSYLADKLFGAFKDVPAIICGAGPSLAKNGAFLAQLQERALIFAGGTAMNALNNQGVLPHFGVGIDPNISQVTRIIMNDAFEVPFFYRNRMYAPALGLIHSPLLHVTGSSGYDIDRYFNQELSLFSAPVAEGFNVVNFSMALAAAMGCNPIILVGVDLAYSNDSSYAPGRLRHPIYEDEELFRTKTPAEELVQRFDIYGQPIKTLWKWIHESNWFSSFVSQANKTVINATEGGIGFALIPNMPLKEVNKAYLQQQFDLDLRIFAEMQKANLSLEVTFEKVLAAFKKLLDSLKSSLELLNILGSQLNVKTISAEEEGLFYKKLDDEPAYQYALKSFESLYEQIFKRDYWRLEIDKELMSAEIFRRRLRNIKVQKMQLLSHVAATLIKDVEEIMQEELLKKQLFLEHSEKIQEGELCLLPQRDISERYHCEENFFELFDPALALDHREEFSEGNLLLAENSYYPNGKLKEQTYRKEGLLHGASRLFSDDGQLLGQSFYIEGKRQGKALKYYPSNTIASLQSFKDGLRCGPQLYFYAQSKKRSIINYFNGQLHGDVLLYYQNGQLARELHFSYGKRHGVERLWTQGGLLFVEAHFKEGLPVGSARVWHDNGVLAYENDYGKEGNASGHVKIWNKEGKLLKRESQSDYFKETAKQTENFTNNILKAFEQVRIIAPLLVGAQQGERAELADVEKTLALVNAEIENLKKLSKDIYFESGLDPANTKEPIWKSPSMQRSIEAQVEQLTEHMHKEIQALKDSLTKAVQKEAQQLVKDEQKDL